MNQKVLFGRMTLCPNHARDPSPSYLLGGTCLDVADDATQDLKACWIIEQVTTRRDYESKDVCVLHARRLDSILRSGFIPVWIFHAFATGMSTFSTLRIKPGSLLETGQTTLCRSPRSQSARHRQA